MKQKRKVKSLIPQKKITSKSLKTAWLVFLWSALYLASITLLSTSVAFWANDWAQAITFTGFDWASPISDKKEVVYAARFATIENLSNRIIDIFMNKDWVLYITPNPVIVNPLNEYTNDISTSKNEVEWVYGHILWWDNNKVYSNNVTIIAWDWNKVKTWSDNATMLWWENNTINQWNWVPSAIIWWSENEIKENHNWSNVIIWWHKNIIESEVSGSAILWWESNTIKNNTKNAIIWWSKVTNKRNNVFAYSTDNFDPENPNSFFLNMKKGVWINMEASGALNGLYVSGAVSLWDIDIKSKDCDSTHSDNYWLEWKYKWCLVGCTKDWWKMFDRGAKCEEICKNESTFNGKCPHDTEIPDSPDDYTAFCTGLAKTDNATQCPNLEAQMQNYKNVVFETKLVNNGNCPESEDKCIFQCRTWFHLTGLITNGYNSSYEYKKCYKDCYYPRDTNETWPQVPTNTIITWYNRDSVFCSSNDPDDSPEHDHCGNHKQTLICYSWQRYDYNKAQNTRSNIPNTTHKYETCETKEYDCPSSYGLTKNYIINDLLENDNGKTWNTGDRSTTTLTRWKYKLCLDYDPQSDHDLECLERDNDNPHTKHYKFVGCNEPEYYEFTGEDWTMRCMKSCTFDTNSWQIRVKHNESTGLYLSNNTTCPTPCEKQTFTCNDWKRENKNGKSIDDYKYTSCNLNSQGHEGYDISENDYIKNKNNSTTYDHIKISVKDKDIFSCKEEIRYKITWCADWYHLSPTLKYCIKEWDRGECEPLVDYSHRTDSDDEPFYSTEFWTLYRYAGSTRAEKVWTSWDDTTTETRNKCHSDCDPGFTRRKTGWKNYCVKDWECPTNPNGPQCPNGKNPNIIRSEQYWSSWTCPWQWVGSRSSDTCHFCADDYEWDGNVCYQCDDGEEWNGSECISVFNWQCYNDSTDDSWNNLSRNYIDSYYTLCKPWISIPGDDIKDDNGNIIGYTWDCQWQGSNTSSQEWCHKCEPWYTWEGGTCTKCNWTNCECIDCVTPVNGKCNTETTINNRWPQNDKDLCTEWEPKHKNWPNDNKYTWDCIWTWGWTSENWCFRCKNWTILSGNKCINPTTNAECGTKSNGKYFTSLAHLMNTNNLCDNWNYSTVDQVNNQFKWTCSDSYWTVDCSATKLECDSVWQSFTNKSEIVNKCKPSSLNLNPTVTEDTNNNKFKWTCTKGDASIECTANKTNTVCKNKLIVEPNWWSIDGHTSDRTLEQDCGSTKEIRNEQKSATTSTSSCYVYFYKDQNSSNFERETARIDSTTNRSFDKWTDSSNCGWFNWSKYTFPWTNWTTCTKTAKWKVNTTTYTTWTVTVAPLEREWYVFLGWTWPKNYSTGTYSHTPASCGEKFYAQWRKIENGQCKNNVLYGCETPSSSWIWIDNIIENGKIVWVLYECRWKDQTATCPFTCPDWEIFSGDSLHNGTCVTQTSNEPICSGWYNYPLPKDAEQNPLAYRYNKILDNFYEVEVDDGDEVPDEIEWYYADHDERVYYDYDNRSCMWTCADGYEHDKDTNKCVAIKCGDNEFYDNETNKCTNICWSVSREFQVSPLTHQTTYTNNYFITGACKWWRNFVGNPSRGDWVTIWRNGPNGCGPFKLKRQCSNGTSTITCDDQNAKVVIFGVNYNNYNNTLTVSQNPFNCFGGNQPCASARSVKVRLTFGLMGGSPTCETNISPTDQERMDYNISNLCPESNGYYGAPRKIEVVWDNTYTANDYLYEDYEVALPEVYVGWGTSCPDFWDAIRIY